MAEDYEIEDQRPDEKIILIRYQHPWVLAKTGLIFILLVLIIVAAFLFWGATISSMVILAIILALLVVYGFMRTFVYRNSLFILTNHRIINISQGNLFARKVQETELENIYNLEYRIDGPIQSLLNFGSIELTTQGDLTNVIKIKNIENPHFILEKISIFRKKAMNHDHC